MCIAIVGGMLLLGMLEWGQSQSFSSIVDSDTSKTLSLGSYILDRSLGYGSIGISTL